MQKFKHEIAMKNILNKLIILAISSTSALHAMETIEIQAFDESNSTCSDISTYGRLEKRLRRQITNYQTYLLNSLGCGFCQFAHKTTNSGKFQHMQVRNSQLTLMTGGLDQTWSPEKIRVFIDQQMAPFEGVIGTNFHDECLDILDEYISQQDHKIFGDFKKCIICCENNAVMVSNSCFHVVYCKQCFLRGDTYQYSIKECCICRDEKPKYFEINLQKARPTCVYCRKESANMLGECGHLFSCKNCIRENQITECAMCFETFEDSIPLIYSQQEY